MKLTIEQVSKQTKLSVATLRVYVSRQKLGTKVGNRRVFTELDVKKLLNNSKRSNRKRKSDEKLHEAKAARKSTQIRASKQSTIETKAPTAKQKREMPKPVKRSFWRSLFGSQKN
jgi:DNA-binding transcriptional MerR regulator